MSDDFDLQDFLPYLLNRAAEQASQGFQAIYKARYGMLRTEWRVLFHLGRYGDMTARQICDRAALHKTKVSRAVKSLETRRFLTRQTNLADRRHEALSLTHFGQAAYRDLSQAAQDFNAQLAREFAKDDLAVLRHSLRRLAQIDAG